MQMPLQVMAAFYSLCCIVGVWWRCATAEPRLLTMSRHERPEASTADKMHPDHAPCKTSLYQKRNPSILTPQLLLIGKMVGETASGTLCSTCAAEFPSNALRREHMHSEWHVYNMKRRITELPPISLDIYENLVCERTAASVRDGSKSKVRECDTDITARSQSHPVGVGEEDRRQADDVDASERCIFCEAVFEDLNTNLGHMASQHGFRIPNENSLQTDIDTLLTYIALVIEEFHACIYCGQEKASKVAAQTHMKAKGHCMMDLSPGSEFLEFWESKTEEASATKVSDSELRLSSGAVASNRRDGRPSVRPVRQRPTRDPADETALIAREAPAQEHSNPTTQHSTSRADSQALAIRDQMGIVGLSDHQRHSLALVQRKAKSREQRFQNEARWVLEKFNNRTKQKHFKVSRSGIHSAMQVC